MHCDHTVSRQGDMQLTMPGLPQCDERLMLCGRFKAPSSGTLGEDRAACEKAAESGCKMVVRPVHELLWKPFWRLKLVLGASNPLPGAL